MAQWWLASLHHKYLHQQFSPYNALHTMQTISSFALRSFLTPTGWVYLINPKNPPDGSSPEISLPSTPVTPSISCFCDDDPLLTEHLFNKDESTFTLRTKLEIRYSPWAMSMMNGCGTPNRGAAKEYTGGPTGGGRGGDDDDGGDGGGGGGDEGRDEKICILPLLTIAFAAFHLGYCIAVWMKDESLDFEFFRTGLGLFCLIAVAAIRLNNQTGVDAYMLGVGASVGVMLWTGERCLVKKEGSPAGIVTFFAAVMATMFSAALYETMHWHG